MNLAIFAKRRQTKDGKTFFTYLSTLTNRSGETITVQVKFREGCGQPKPETCPRCITVDKKAANLSVREVLDDNGVTHIRNVLWVAAWNDGGAYVDHSLDDYD